MPVIDCNNPNVTASASLLTDAMDEVRTEVEALAETNTDIAGYSANRKVIGDVNDCDLADPVGTDFMRLWTFRYPEDVTTTDTDEELDGDTDPVVDVGPSDVVP